MEIPAYLALALVCAWCANVLAGPTRRLSWRLKEPARPLASTLPTRLAAAPPPPAPAASPKLVVKADASAPRSMTITPVPAPPPDPKAELMARFPALVQEAQGAITGEEAAWLHAHGAVFLDARRTAMYEQGHIPGARSFSAWEDGLAEKVDQLALFTADLKLPIVVYCSGGDCHDSHLVAQKLWLAGFRNLRIYTDGYPDWEARKQPVASGSKP
ncbi:MAG: rhodanese-like domain-containing protein [Acidobacteriota bacterium]|nr:rhodanese-like domain-containing protein [Acidobacteriota bacterium]